MAHDHGLGHIGGIKNPFKAPRPPFQTVRRRCACGSAMTRHVPQQDGPFMLKRARKRNKLLVAAKRAMRYG
jgi:hypothetical protein